MSVPVAANQQALSYSGKHRNNHKWSVSLSLLDLIGFKRTSCANYIEKKARTLLTVQ